MKEKNPCETLSKARELAVKRNLPEVLCPFERNPVCNGSPCPMINHATNHASDIINHEPNKDTFSGQS